MKILYLNILYSPHLYGGAERTLQILTEGMASRGHEVVVLTTGPERGLHEERVNGIRVIRAGVRNVYWNAVRHKAPGWKRAIWHLLDTYNLPMRRVVEGVLRRERPDVVSLHNLPGFSVSAWDAVRAAGVPMVQVLHDQYLLCPRTTMFHNGKVCRERCTFCRTLRQFHPRLSAGVDAVVGVSRFVLEHHLSHGYFAGASEIRVIHNIRTTAPAGAAPRKPDGTVRFGFIGTLHQSKGIELLIRSFQGAARNGWELHIAGSAPGDYETELRETFAATNVIFHGVQKPQTFYPSIDALVVPSIWNDTLPGVVFEGLSYALPIIGARRGGIPEMVEEGVTGLLFDPDRPEELAVAMTRLADDLPFRNSASAAAREASRYFHDTKRFFSSYEELYSSLCLGQLGVPVGEGEATTVSAAAPVTVRAPHA